MVALRLHGDCGMNSLERNSPIGFSRREFCSPVPPSLGCSMHFPDISLAICSAAVCKPAIAHQSQYRFRAYAEGAGIHQPNSRCPFGAAGWLWTDSDPHCSAPGTGSRQRPHHSFRPTLGSGKRPLPADDPECDVADVLHRSG